MPDVDDDQEGNPSPFTPLYAELDKMRKSTLTAAITDVDKIIELLESTRNQVEEGMKHPASGNRIDPNHTLEADSHKISMAMTRLQNPVKERFEAITTDLKEVTKAQRSFGKALDKVGD